MTTIPIEPEPVDPEPGDPDDDDETASVREPYDVEAER